MDDTDREREIHMGLGSGKWLAVTIVLGIAAFITSPNALLGGFWGAPPSLSPTGAQMALLMLLTAIQCLAFGLGAAFKRGMPDPAVGGRS